MNFITMAVGALALGYGIFSGIMRKINPSSFKKLEPMKRRYGEKAGSVIHFIGYVAVPILFGIVAIISGYHGKNIFSVLR